MTYCFIGADPTCENLECDSRRTHRYVNVLFIAFSAGPSYIILPCVMFSTMAIMYRTVLAQDKILQQFGVGALASQKRNHNAANNNTNTENMQMPMNKRKEKQTVVTHWFKSSPG